MPNRATACRMLLHLGCGCCSSCCCGVEITIAIAACSAARVANGAFCCAAAAAAAVVVVTIVVVAVAVVTVARSMCLHLNKLARCIDASSVQRWHTLWRCHMLLLLMLLLSDHVAVVVVVVGLLLYGCRIECIDALLHLRRMRRLMAMRIRMMTIGAAQRRHRCRQWRWII